MDSPAALLLCGELMSVFQWVLSQSTDYMNWQSNMEADLRTFSMMSL